MFLSRCGTGSDRRARIQIFEEEIVNCIGSIGRVVAWKGSLFSASGPGSDCLCSVFYCALASRVVMMMRINSTILGTSIRVACNDEGLAAREIACKMTFLYKMCTSDFQFLGQQIQFDNSRGDVKQMILFAFQRPCMDARQKLQVYKLYTDCKWNHQKLQSKERERERERKSKKG